MTSEEVRAAGAVVWRAPAQGGRVELLLIHRPKYDDWGWPKGKAEPTDLDDEANALREVKEETGYYGRLGPALGSIHYLDPRGRPKTVQYWALELGGGEFTPNDEVDEILWLKPDEARTTLSHALDREVLDRFLALRPRW